MDTEMFIYGYPIQTSEDRFPPKCSGKARQIFAVCKPPEANMNATDAKNEHVSRSELLFNKQRLLDIHEKYGDATEIKKHVKTTAFIYEIRTALRFWKGGRATHRTNDALWTRLEAYENGHDEVVERIEANTEQGGVAV